MPRARLPLPESRLETRSPIVRQVLLSATGLAWTVLVALSIELLGTPWSGSSPLRTAGWVLVLVVVLSLLGWWLSTLVERARLSRIRRLSRPVPGPAAPLRPTWSPGPEPALTPADEAVVEAVLAGLRRQSVAEITVPDADPALGPGVNDPLIIARSVAHHVLRSDGAPPAGGPPGPGAQPEPTAERTAGPTSGAELTPGTEPASGTEPTPGAESTTHPELTPGTEPAPGAQAVPGATRIVYRNLAGASAPGERPDLGAGAYAAASTLLPAFGMGVPDCSDAALGRAGRRLVDMLKAAPTLVVLDEVDGLDAVDWLVEAWPADGSLPWLLLVPPPTPSESAARTDVLGDEARLLARALAELPPCELGVDAIAVLHEEAADGGHRPLHALLGELRRHGMVESLAGGARYRVPPHLGRQVLHDAGPHPTAARLQGALVALLRHFADLCDHWTAALHTAANAAKAAQWFRAEEPVLHALVTGAPEDADVTVVDQLTRIAGALDVWYARQHKPCRSFQVSAALHGLADRAGDVANRELAQLRQRSASRLGAEPEPDGPGPLPVRRLSSSLHARRLHEDGLADLARAVRSDPADDDLLERAEDAFKRSWRALPRADLAGEIAVAVNLAVVHLHQGRLDLARDRLDLAEFLTHKASDLSGEAHVHELHGVVAWAAGDPYRAVHRWLRGFGLFGTLDDPRGESRCLQHLATAVLADPGLVRLTLPDPEDPETDPFDEVYALLNARKWLERSLLLRPDQDERCLAARYLHEADRRLPPRGATGGVSAPRRPADPGQPAWFERFGSRLDNLLGRRRRS